MGLDDIQRTLIGTLGITLIGVALAGVLEFLLLPLGTALFLLALPQ
jgi:hypothetical protein